MTITVTGLYTYPIKSCGGLSHTAVTLEARGLQWDRRWMVVDDEGMFYTQRQQHHMTLIQTRLSAEALHVTAPQMPELTIPLARTTGEIVQAQVWNDVCAAWDEGAAAREWFSAVIGAPARLVRMTDTHFRQLNRQYVPYAAQTGFADGYPILLAGEESLAELNRRLQERGKTPVPMSRFRPNIVVQGAPAFDEDSWTRFVIDELAFEGVKLCARCVMVTLDPATGQVPEVGEPTATLNTFRNQQGKVMFGQNVVGRGSGVLRLGAVVRLTE